LLVNPGGEELRQPAVRADYAQGTVAGPRELGCCAHDAVEDRGQAQILTDRDDRFEQGTQPVLGRHQLIGAGRKLPLKVIDAPGRRPRQYAGEARALHGRFTSVRASAA
jgi:hypothetical protein